MNRWLVRLIFSYRMSFTAMHLAAITPYRGGTANGILMEDGINFVLAEDGTPILLE